VLREVAAETERDLRQIMDEVKRLNEQKARLREFVDQLAAESSEIAARLRSEFTDVLGAIDATSLESVLQLFMEQKSKLEEMISNVLKASSETESGVIENLK
jgi:DNA anti-recombination protein RmuC